MNEGAKTQYDKLLEIYVEKEEKEEKQKKKHV
jgi:hypothetical protein